MNDKLDKPVRPSHVPNRLKWWPGEPTQRALDVDFREGNPADIYPLASLLRTKPFLTHKWITQHNYSVWCVLRNKRTIIAAIVARHGPTETTVLRFFCTPCKARAVCLAALLRLIQVEVPEWRTVWTVTPRDEEWISDALHALDGWKVEHSDDETGRNLFVCPAFIRIASPDNGEKDRKKPAD